MSSARGIQASEDQAPFITDVALTNSIAWFKKLPHILPLNSTLMSTKRKEYSRPIVCMELWLQRVRSSVGPSWVADYCLRPLDWSNKSHNLI
ncbi:hypothetical protein K443DRAFT_672894 [Laccaria amethystina LaAM-08-1]|uniref:Uncharacterized protein n=1 Tax=Laccaria amethystina LaAM-08-1 TaxID=1095629 RepID=A0A0C9X768_9AGAR|nr:hypothetical protein K443DRAFT_672894 [Laccaria amethystina LaAM-08-1]